MAPSDQVDWTTLLDSMEEGNHHTFMMFGQPESYFDRMKAQASARGLVLCFADCIQNGRRLIDVFLVGRKKVNYRGAQNLSVVHKVIQRPQDD